MNLLKSGKTFSNNSSQLVVIAPSIFIFLRSFNSLPINSSLISSFFKFIFFAISNFNGENFIYTPIIEYLGIPYKVVLDLHTVTGINENSFINTKPLYRFRKELLVDIQQKIASHTARPGFFNMNDYLA